MLEQKVLGSSPVDNLDTSFLRRNNKLRDLWLDEDTISNMNKVDLLAYYILALEADNAWKAEDVWETRKW